MLCFDKKYFYLTLVLLVMEILIALFVNDRIIRPYVGDFLAIILVYCALKSFLRSSVFAAATAALLISFAIEAMQYVEILQRLSWQHSRLLRTMLGTAFSWADMGCYTAGFGAILLIEKRRWSKMR